MKRKKSFVLPLTVGTIYKSNIIPPGSGSNVKNSATEVNILCGPSELKQTA